MIIEIKPPTERQPGPYEAKRPCSGCGAFLSRYNPGPLCDPCSPQGPADYGEIFQRISEMTDPRARRRAFEVLAEMAGEEEA